jgi:hypothetical protein
MTNHGVAHVVEELRQVRALQVFSGGVIYEFLSEFHAFELAQLLLIYCAHAQITDELTGSPLPLCHFRF